MPSALAILVAPRRWDFIRAGWPSSTLRTNCGDETWLLCEIVEKPTDNKPGLFRHHGRPQGDADQPQLAPAIEGMKARCR